MTVAAGAHLNQYEIITCLGAGGMGEVWLAEDTRLRRKVALKLLPEEFTRDAARVRRFEQEARAASALNHPNIITIHEIGEADGAHYIATEFIDGQTLRQRLKEKLTVNVALDIAIQIAAALAAAHEAGITHRDIKPENVMQRRDGIVKVLDFGLAKLTEQRPDVVNSEAPTIAKVNTDPGTVMGTASYMSPEQARGQEVDARTDIFSLGVMLYEMIAGRAPFVGVNALEVISEILKTEPPSLKSQAPDTPAELQRLVSKALRKDREQRYQHVKDLLIDLKDLKQEIEFEAKLRGVQARTGAEAAATTTSQKAEAATNEVAAARTTSSAEIILGELKRHKTGVLIGLAALLAGVVALAYGLYRFAAPKQEQARFQNVKFTRLTAVGDAGRGASISPDGKLICYVLVEGGKLSLWTKAIATGSLVQLVSPAEVAELGNTTFSPDGNFVYYRVVEKDGQSTLHQIPALGGASKKILTNIRSAITFSPDGRQFAFMRRRDLVTGNLGPLVMVNADGSGERVLVSDQGQSRMVGVVAMPSWSPDGSLIAFAGSPDDNFTHQTVMGFFVKTGEVKPLTAQTWELVSRVAWFGDGSGLAFVARELGDPNTQVFRLSFPGGEAQRITNDLNSYGVTTLSLTADSKSLLVVQGFNTSDLWVGPLADARRARQVTRNLSARGSGNNHMAWTPDGRIVYGSLESGNLDLWMMDSDGGNRRQLTDSPAADQFPAVSPDGRYIVFNSTRGGKLNLWRMDSNGENLRRLTSGDLERIPAFSPDGRWVLYDSWNSNPASLWKVAIEGGSPVRLNDGGGSRAVASPDGKLIAYVYSERQQGQRYKIGLIPFEGGAQLKTLDFTPAPPARHDIRWAPDGRSLIYIDAQRGGANLWRLPLDGGSPQPLTDFKDEQIWAFDVTRDGKQFVVARGSNTADVVLISEVK